MAYTDIDDPSEYFQTTLYTGNGGTQSITNTGNSDLQPNWCWFKMRSHADQHVWIDSVRGSNKAVYSDATAAESTQTHYFSSFDSDGFSLGNSGIMNADGRTYVSWQWKAGTAVSGNTSGSGTAKAYSGSVNTDAGFSIIKYIGNGTANHKIPHHLGAVLNWIIVKNLAETENWQMFHQSLGNTKTMSINLSDDEYGADNRWNNTSPTSSLFNLGNGDETNKNDVSYIAYSFAEKQGYSKFGSYVGNGNADGPFNYTGFKPAFLLYKNVTDNNKPWYLVDNTRDINNPGEHYVFANLTDAENDNHANKIDFLSNGYKSRSTGTTVNADGKEYIYMAFAENPFVTSKGVPATAR